MLTLHSLVFVFCFILIQNNVLSSLVSCPNAEPILGVELNQIAGEWYATDSIFLKTDESPEVRESLACISLKLKESEEINLNFTVHIAPVSSTEKSEEDAKYGSFNVNHSNSGFTIDLEYNMINNEISTEGEEKETYAYVLETDPERYLILMQCVIFEQKRYTGVATLFSRLDSSRETLPVLSTEERTNITDTILHKTGAHVTKRLYSNNNCFNRNRL